MASIFFSILEIQNEFGIILGFLLAAMIGISSIWLVTGTRQNRKICSWSRRYKEFMLEREQIDKNLHTSIDIDRDRCSFFANFIFYCRLNL